MIEQKIPYTNRYPKICYFLLCLGDYGISVIQLYIYFSYATLLSPHEILLLIPPSLAYCSIYVSNYTYNNQTMGEVFINNIYIFAREHIFSQLIKKFCEPNWTLLINTLL